MTIIENVESLIDLQVDLSQTLVVIVTLCTAVVFGLGVLHRPSRATVVWSFAFGLGLLGTYVWVAAVEMDLPALRALASGLMLCSQPLIWLGLRLYAGQRAPWAPVVMFVGLVPTVLALTVDSEAFPTFFRICFAAAGVFACGIAIDLAQLKPVSRDVILPLMLSSGGFVVVAALNVVWPLLSAATDPDAQMTVLRDVNGIGTLVSSFCAAITILLLVRSAGTDATAASSGDGGDSLIRTRVERLHAHQETGWSLLDVRLDDTGDLREASSATGFGLILERFRDHVTTALPPSADIEQAGDSRILALLPGSDEAVEHHVRNVLDRVSAVDVADGLGAVRVSASVGWATMLDARFDYDKLVELAAQRAQQAGELGGDRWERTRRGTVTMAIRTV